MPSFGMSKLPLLLLLGSVAHQAAGFAASRPLSLSSHRPSCRLRDSLFDDIFENADDGGGGGGEVGQEVLPPKDYGDDAPPFSEAETPRARARRMEMARELQKAFYKEPTASASSSSSSVIEPPTRPAGGSNALPYGSTALRKLPTLTTNDGIKGADESALLPGHQFVWNVHNPQHCHMFHSILSGPAPWHFAHVHLSGSASSPKSSEDGEAPIDNVQSHRDMREQLNSKDHLYGTLLRITDRRFRDEDGSIVLAVQSIDRLRIHDVASVPGTFLCTDAQLSPEEELMRSYLDEALMSSASYISSHGGGTDRRALSCPSAVSGAARAAATADATRVRRFEYFPICLEEKPRRPSSASALRADVGDSNATRKVKDAIRKQDEAKEASGPEYVNVVQLVNYDSFSYSSLAGAKSVTSQALRAYWDQLAKERMQGSWSEEDLFEGAGTGSTSSSFFLPEPPSSSSLPASLETTEMTEYHVWVALDEMIRILSMASAATVPLPSQLLGLLPKRSDWPHEFVLEDYAQSLSTPGSSIGTAFKSPFVRVDKIRSSNPSSYSPLRRTQRLSYAIWLMLDGLAVAGAQPSPPPRHEILNMSSIEQRLNAAKHTLEGINFVLKKMIPENRNDGEEK